MYLYIAKSTVCDCTSTHHSGSTIYMNTDIPFTNRPTSRYTTLNDPITFNPNSYLIPHRSSIYSPSFTTNMSCILVIWLFVDMNCLRQIILSLERISHWNIDRDSDWSWSKSEQRMSVTIALCTCIGIMEFTICPLTVCRLTSSVSMCFIIDLCAIYSSTMSVMKTYIALTLIGAVTAGILYNDSWLHSFERISAWFR